MLHPIYCIGGANVDHKLTVQGILSQETSNPVSTITTFGGVARNVAENLSHWTDNIYLQCMVGKDKEGKELLAYLQQNQVNVDSCITLTHHSTSHYYAVMNVEGELQIAFADMNIYNHILFETFVAPWKNWLPDSIVFLDTNLPTSVIEQAILYYGNTVKLCMDPVSVSKAKKLPPSLENVFLIKPNQIEASVLTNMTISSISDCIKAGCYLLERGVKNVVISLGKNGYVLVNEKLQQHFNAMPCHSIKDVNGAGDAFIAGILYGLQQNSTIIDACQWGAAAAAMTLQSHHTVNKNITLSQLKAFKMRSGYATIF